MNRKTRKPSGGRRIKAEAPSRQDILNLLEDHGRPLKRKEIVDRLDVVSDDSREILRRRLQAMLRDGQLVRNRRSAYGLPKKMDLLAGRVPVIFGTLPKLGSTVETHGYPTGG